MIKINVSSLNVHKDKFLILLFVIQSNIKQINITKLNNHYFIIQVFSIHFIIQLFYSSKFVNVTKINISSLIVD